MEFIIRPHYDLFIDGVRTSAHSTETLDCISPLTQESLFRFPDADAEDVDRAVKAAHRAFVTWSQVPARKRQALLEACADALVANVDRLAWLETTNCGKPLRESHANVLVAADRLRYYAGACRVLEGTLLPVTRDITSYGQRAPLGVVGIIGAWNFPLNMFIGKIAPAIATGNTVVYKPADTTPLTTLESAELLASILPAGVVNVVTGRGTTTGAALVAHPGVRKISVTGSTATGRRVMEGASATLKRLTLELGGKNAQIVYPDADLDRAAQAIALGAFLNQGQVCTAGSRILAHSSIASGLKDRLRDLIARLRIGDPFDSANQMGTLASKLHFDRVRDYVELARQEGGRLVAAERQVRVEKYPRGLFMAPMLFENLDPAGRVQREEIFGPVATFSEWSDERAMLEEVNGVEQGLAAGVWTRDLAQAHAAAQAIESGRVWVNCYNLFPSGAAFGGSKASGFGREDAFETMFDFTEIKNVIVDAGTTWRNFYD
ncbi:aldehyde dehydrogenase family protein [Hydrogenophaga sp.]|jgi:acyl-CoA reductase-like NAD-dependent aldehyde dehydrogenase|uniref:aldehyde dehydrogenase family protein n=1 Tax=Hydrogenophaga sp. TaxID=1904254 RepID=UPI003AF800DF